MKSSAAVSIDLNGAETESYVMPVNNPTFGPLIGNRRIIDLPVLGRIDVQGRNVGDDDEARTKFAHDWFARDWIAGATG
jgi:hypothetical protein